MAQKRDLIDEFIDIKNDWQSLQNPLANVTSALTAQPGEIKSWNPADYKEKPRANIIPCTSCQGKDLKLCDRCVTVCPVHAIDLTEGYIDIADSCRKCGLCSSACPSECFTASQITPRKLYERIARAAMAYEHAYVTCTRAIGRMPQDNEVVLPCVGAVPREVWFALLADYKNVSVYLPLGICDRCRNVTGEEAYVDAIGWAEDHTGRAMGLEVNDKDLDYTKNHAFERKEFLSGMAKQGITAVSVVNPALAAARAVTSRLDANTKRINAIMHTLEGETGVNASRKRRVLTQRRQLMLTTLQKHPKLAARFEVKRPVCDASKCTLCGECAAVCPTKSCEVSEAGVFRAEPSYCIECGACIDHCSEHALRYEAYDARELVVPDKEEVERKKREAEQKAEIERLKKQGREQLKRGLDILDNITNE